MNRRKQNQGQKLVENKTSSGKHKKPGSVVEIKT
jgi:hypothetical protein